MDELYNELLNLRQHIKDTAETERVPTVCTDDVLRAIAEMEPVKLSDFDSIPGVGKSFIENYGEQFLRVINKYLRRTQSSGFTKVTITKNVQETLKELEKKLININRRNHLLYMPKLQSKYAVDLFSPDYDARDIILGTGRKIEVANLKNESQLKKITALLRSNNRLVRDKGQNDLFIAYPFVKGKLTGENFEVRAPLALFPVTEERTPSSIKLSLDRSRDILYNTTLILAYFKTNNLNQTLPPDEIEDTAKETFFESIKVFYKNADLEIQLEESENELHPFVDYTADTFPEFQSGQLFLDNSIVIGTFPICSSSIQKDFQKIVEEGSINTLLNDLLADSDDAPPSTDENPILENNITYINDMNSSQEKVLNTVQVADELVMEGPPGTGKSQTITSLISQAALNGQTVLMVSEKKTALDVVYSRLGDLSRFAIVIDDVNDKNLFYSQMSNIISQNESGQTEIKSSQNLSAEIDTQIDSLERIAKELYTVDKFGIEPYRLYLNCPHKNFSNTEEFEKEKLFEREVPSPLLDYNYETLSKCSKTFTDEDLVSKADEYTSLEKEFPWMKNLRDTLTDFDVQRMNEKWLPLKNEIEILNRKNAIARLFSGGKTRGAVKQFVETFFDANTKQNRNLLLKSSDDFTSGIERYGRYHALRPAYTALSPEEKNYFTAMKAVQRQCENSLSEANREVKDFVLYRHLMDFETSHRTTLMNISNFPATIRSISEDIQKKRKITRENLERKLFDSLALLTQSKRHNDIQRAVESKRRMSVNKFINKFDFELFKSIKIWLLTPEVVSEIIPLQIGVFDLLVFDEASQMYVEKGLPSILRAKKVVVAGDQKQLRPSSLGTGRMTIDEDALDEDEEISAALEEESLLDLAKYRYPDTLLNFHYRSKYEELIAFSNYAFYGGQLYVSPNVAEPETPPIEVHKMSGAIWDKRRNQKEAEYIVGLLKDIFANRKENETIGIITFNTSQRDLIDDLIDKECMQDNEFAEKIRVELARTQDGEDIGLFVKNIENVQGDERDIIIFSIGYAKNASGKFIQNFGWLNQAGGENRLNVAISRAKKKVHIVTSFEPNEMNVDNVKNPGPAILQKYLEYAAAVSTKNRKLAKDILLSFCPGRGDSQSEREHDGTYLDDVAQSLGEEGLEFERDLGIGGYSIDFAIKKNGRYVLGIECDSGLYRRSSSARDRDYHRQKYLESRGWKLIRIWSPSWWKDKASVVQMISDAYDTAE
ncbi:MAG: HRDC domain-containing protein [Treponema sp.]|nr:HRDC domain-containing protein [Treponema sp.]